MAEIIGAPGIFPDTASFLPDNYYNYKCFGIHLLISFLNNTKNILK